MANRTPRPPLPPTQLPPGNAAGFPFRFSAPSPIPGTVLKEAQGLVGGDFECATSVVPGVCAYRSMGPAAAACTNSLAANCTSMVVFTRGLDGCSEEVVVLKRTNLAPANTFMAPTGRGLPGAHRVRACYRHAAALRPAAGPACCCQQGLPRPSPFCSLRARKGAGCAGEAATGGAFGMASLMLDPRAGSLKR